jgi:hypothetical protein
LSNDDDFLNTRNIMLTVAIKADSILSDTNNPIWRLGGNTENTMTINPEITIIAFCSTALPV